MGEIERRLSVQEKIEELERNKITLHPPVFDSTLSLSTGKKSPPDVDTSASETPRNTIRVIKMNEAENLTQQNEFSGNKADHTDKMEENATIEINVNFTPLDSESKKNKDANGKNAQKDDEGKGGDENKKDLDTEKQADNTLETQEERKLELKISTEEKHVKDKHIERESDNKSETVQHKTEKMEVKMKEGSSKKSEPLVPLSDEQIDKIVAKYADLHKDKTTLDKYLDFFFDMDKPHYGYFTYEMLVYKLHREGWNLSEQAIASMFHDLDADKDFLVSLDEYLAEMSKSPRKEALKEDELREVFQHIDADKDGFLSRNDLEAYITKSSVEVPTICLVEEVMSYDKSGNREKVDFDEFHAWYRAKRRRNGIQGNDWFDGLMPLTVTAERSHLDYRRIDSTSEKA